MLPSTGAVVHHREDLFCAKSTQLHPARSEEHTSELQSPDCISYAVFCLEESTRLNSSHRIASRMPSSA